MTSSGDWHSSFYSAIPRVLETHRKFGIMLSLLGLAIRHSFLWSHLYPKQEWGIRPTNPVSPTIPKETVLCCADWSGMLAFIIGIYMYAYKIWVSELWECWMTVAHYVAVCLLSAGLCIYRIYVPPPHRPASLSGHGSNISEKLNSCWWLKNHFQISSNRTELLSVFMIWGILPWKSTIIVLQLQTIGQNTKSGQENAIPLQV